MKDTATFHTIQRLNLPQDGYIPEEMFFLGPGRVEYDTAATEDRVSGSASITVPAGETVWFDTYFNLLSLFKWRQYTSIRDLRVDITLQGDAVVTLYGISTAANAEFGQEPDLTEDRIRENTSVVISQEIHAAAAETCRLFHTDDLESLPEFLYLEVSAGERGAVIEDVAYRAKADTLNDLNIAACFCTYRREEDIRRNIANLEDGIIRNEKAFLHDRLHVFVADNGNTLPLGEYDNNDRIHVFYNRNYGGSAGFTRCMIESCLRYTGTPFTHVVLMDDDALITAPVVERLGRFLTVLKPQYAEYMIGGAILAKEVPYLQQESGIYLDARRWKREMREVKLDLRSISNVLINELGPETEINHEGWWFSCIPTKFISEKNLPMPFFLHHDDAEYGLRNGGRFLRLNGLCIWHPTQGGKAKLKANFKYYDARNSLIVQSAYFPELTAADTIRRLFKECVLSTLNYRYANFTYYSAGYEQYYKGVESFKALNPEQNHRDLMQGKGFETCSVSKEEIARLGINRYDLYGKGGRFRKIRKILNWLVPSFKGKALFSFDADWKIVDIFGIKEIYMIEPESGEGYVLRKSYRQALRSIAGLAKLTIHICIVHTRIHRRWHENIDTFRSYQYWEKYLNI